MPDLFMDRIEAAAAMYRERHRGSFVAPESERCALCAAVQPGRLRDHQRTITHIARINHLNPEHLSAYLKLAKPMRQD